MTCTDPYLFKNVEGFYLMFLIGTLGIKFYTGLFILREDYDLS